MLYHVYRGITTQSHNSNNYAQMYMSQSLYSISAHVLESEQNWSSGLERLSLACVLWHPVFVPLQFFTGQSMSTEGMVGMLNYREDGLTPYILFFKDGLISEKCVSIWQNFKLIYYVVSWVLHIANINPIILQGPNSCKNSKRSKTIH